MARPSKVDRLDPEIREEIAKQRERGHTLDEILAHLRRLGVDEISRSGLHRHVQGLDALSEKLARSRTIAEALVRKLGDAPENRTARLNIELMHSCVTDLMLASASNAADGTPITLEPETVHFLAKSLDHLSRASRSDADLTVRLRRELAAEAKQKLDALEKGAGKAGKGGLDPETLRRVRTEIYGLPG